MSFFSLNRDVTYNKIDVSKISVNKSVSNQSTGIIDTDKLNATTEIETDTLYCKSLVVSDSLYIPVENMPNISKRSVVINRVAGNKSININANMGKLSYDGILKDLKSTTDTGDKRSVTDTFNSVTNNSRFKENILLKGWSEDNNTRATLYQPNGTEIDLEEHVYYQGCGYIVGFNNPSADKVTSREETIVVPPRTETIVTPATTTVIEHPAIDNIIPVPSSYTVSNESYVKYENIASNPNFDIPDGEIREFSSNGSADNLAFDTNNNCYVIKYMAQTITLIRSTGEVVQDWLSGQYYYSIAIDRDNNIWINTFTPTKKLYKITVDASGNILTNNVHIDFDDNSTLITENISNLGFNKNNELFMMAVNNIYKISTDTPTFSLYFSNTGEPDPRAICFDDNNNLLYAGRLGKKVYKIIDNNQSSNKINYSVTENQGKYYFNDGVNTITDSLELMTNNTYIFNLSAVGIINNIIAHPFYISTLQNDSSSNIHSSNEISIDGNLLTFTPTSARTLFYNCQKHTGMTDNIVITSQSGNIINYSVTENGGRYYFNNGTDSLTNSLPFLTGNTYIFDLTAVGILNINTQGHPFYLSTSQNNPTTNIHDSDEITINGDILTFTPTVQRTLYYNCSIHANMSNVITVSSSTNNTVNYLVTNNNGRYNFNDGSAIISDQLNLVTGNTYVFDLSAVGILNLASHPFYISTSINNPLNNIHSGGEISINGNILTFTPSVARTLFYNCEIHSSMSGNITISEGTPIVPPTREFYAGISTSIAPIFGLAFRDNLVYISDQEGNYVKTISPTGVITNYIGNGQNTGVIDSEYSLLGSSIVKPSGMVFDNYGDLYITQNQYPVTSTHHIKAVGFNTVKWESTPGEKVIEKQTIQMPNSPNFEIPLDEVKLFKDIGISECYNFTFDQEDNIYLAKYDTGDIIKINASDKTHETWTTVNYALWDITIDSINNLYVITHDTDYNRLIKINSNKQSTILIQADTNEEFKGLTIDKHGHLYVSSDKNVIYKIYINNEIAIKDIYSNSGNITLQSLCFNNDDELISVDTLGLIYKVTSAGKLMYVGGAEDGEIDNYGTTDYKVVNNYGIAVDKNNNIYVSSWSSHIILQIDVNGLSKRFAGVESISGSNDTTRLKSTLSNPLALNFNSYGDLYILDNVFCKIRAIGFDQVYTGGYDITNNIYNNPQLYVQNGELIDYSNGTNSVDIAISNTDIKYYTVPNGDIVRSIFTTQEDIILYRETDSNFKCTWLTTDTKNNVYVSSPSGGIKRINSAGGSNFYLGVPIIKGEIISLNFTPGSGYSSQEPPTIKVIHHDGTNFTLSEPVISNGVVTSLEITDGGSNYLSSYLPSFVITHNGGSGFQITDLVVRGIVDSVPIVGAGTGYSSSSLPIININHNSGSGLTFGTITTDEGSVTDIEIVDNGTNYLSNNLPTFDIYNNGTVEHVITDAMNYGNIRGIDADKNNNLYFVTENKKIYRFNSTSNETTLHFDFSHLSEIGNNFQGLSVDLDNNIYFAEQDYSVILKIPGEPSVLPVENIDYNIGVDGSYVFLNEISSMLYSLEANSGESLSQELTDFPDLGSLTEWTIKVNFSTPSSGAGSFSLFSTNRTKNPGEAWTAGDIMVNVTSNIMYFSIFPPTGNEWRATDSAGLQQNTDYEVSIQKATDGSLTFQLTNLNNNTPVSFGAGSNGSALSAGAPFIVNNIDWSRLEGAPVFVGGTPASNSHPQHNPPDAGQLITKVSLDVPPYTNTTTSTSKPILNLRTGSTYSFTIDESIASEHPFFITTSSIGGQAAEDNSIHSGSEITIAYPPPETIDYNVSVANDEYIFNTSGPAIESITVTNSYSLEANSGASLSQELTGLPDIGTLSEWTIKLYFSIPSTGAGTFNLFNTNRTPVGGQSPTAGDIMVTVDNSHVYVAIYDEHGTLSQPSYEQRAMYGVIAAGAKDYELVLQRGSDDKLYIVFTNLTDNTVNYSSNLSNASWSALVGAPVFVGGDSRSGTASSNPPDAGQLITKVTLESPIPPTTTTNVLGTNIPAINANIGSTYIFTIDSGIASTHPFFITTSSTGGQDAIDNSIHSESEVTVAGNVITFKPTQARTLYYHSGSNANMGGTINVSQPPVSNITFTPTQTRTLYYHCGNHDNMGNVINVTSNINYQIEIFAGELGTSGNQDGALSSATFAGIKGLDCDMNGSLYVSCYDGHTIRKIENNVVRTIAGQFNTSGNTNGQNGLLSKPYGICLDQHSDLYVSEFDGSIRVLGQDLNVSAENLSSYLDDPDYTSVMGEVSTLRNNVVVNSSSFVMDSDNNFYLINNNSQVIKLSKNEQQTVIWSSETSVAVDLAIDINNNIYIAHNSNIVNSGIDRYVPSSEQLANFWTASANTDFVSAICEFEDKIFSVIHNPQNPQVDIKLVEIEENKNYFIILKLNNIITNKLFFNNNIRGITPDSKGNLYLTEIYDENHSGRILKYIKDDGIIVYCGSYGNEGVIFNNGYGSSVKLCMPHGICVDSYDNIYIADSGNHVIRKIDISGKVTTFAGINEPGDINGHKTDTAKFNHPISLQFNKYGVLYVLDKNSGNIRNIKFDNRKNFISETVPAKIFDLRDSENTIYQTLDNFPDLEQLDKWTMSIDFNWDGTGNWQSIIGSMYNNNLVNNRGWGLWISHPSRQLHWSGGPPFEGQYLYNIENMVISPNTNYKIDINKNTSDILVETANPDLNIDYLEVETLKDSLTTLPFSSLVTYAGYVYFLTNNGINRISHSDYTPELIQSHTGSNYDTGHIKSFAINKNTGTIYFTTMSRIHQRLPNGVINLGINTSFPSSWNGSRDSGILFTSQNGDLFSVSSGNPAVVSRHLDGTVTDSFISFTGEVNGAVMDSNNNIFLISKAVSAGSDEVIFKYSISGTGGLLSTPGLGAVIGGSSIIESITIDDAENLYIGVSLDSVNSSRIIKLFAYTSYTTYEVIAGNTSSFYDNTVLDDNTDPIAARLAGVYAMDFDTFGDLYFANLKDIRIMRLSPPPTLMKKSMLNFKLINRDTDTTVNYKYLYTPLDVKEVNTGGNWDTNSSEIFNGHISRISVDTLEDPIITMTTLPQIYSRSIYNFIPETTVIQTIPGWSETIHTPEISTEVFIDGYTTTVTITSLNFEPMAFMSRLDYFVVTIDSFSNMDKVPVNFLDIELLNNIDTDLQINMVRNKGKYTLEVSVNSTKEVKWFGVINLKKIYIKKAQNRQLDNELKYNQSDNITSWEPVFTNQQAADTCFKFLEGLEFKNISPFTDNVVDEEKEYFESVIDDSLMLRYKTVQLLSPTNPDSARELVGLTVLDRTSSSFNYNIYGYQSMFMIQPTLTLNKKLTTSYSHIHYINSNNGTKRNVLYENEFGNSFTKDATKDSSEFMTSYLNNDDENEYFMDITGQNRISNSKINYVFQLKEKEVKFQPTLAILYYRHFCAKDFNDASESPAHREGVYYRENIYDIAENVQTSLVLYKNIGNFTQDVSKEIYLTQRDTGNDDYYYFKLGTHNFIKTYVNIRDITNDKNAFFTHYASIIIPTYTTMRQFFTNNREANVTDINEMKQKFIEKYVTPNTYINDLDTNSYESGTTYTMPSSKIYINANGKKYISENSVDETLINFDINILTEPVLEQIVENDIILNGIQSYQSLENAYNTFDVKFPLKISCTSKETSKYQVYLLMEINSFIIDTY